MNGKEHGRGKKISANGDVYEGEYLNGKRHGRGKKITANGDVYEGDFVDDKRDGKGSIPGPVELCTMENI